MLKKSDRKVEQVVFRVEPRQRKRLLAFANARGMTLAAMIREAVSEYVEREKRKDLKGVKK